MATSQSAVDVITATMTAGAADVAHTVVNVAGSFGGTFSIKLINGATGPTVAGQVQVELSNDGTNWFTYGAPYVGKLANLGVFSPAAIAFDKNTQQIRYTSGGNTVQDVTLRIETIWTTAVA